MQVVNPLITDLLAREVHEAAQVPKPTALGTPMRYSSAHSCLRQMGYAAFGVEPSDPVDLAGAWVMHMGTMVHEACQKNLAVVFPNAEFEVASQLGESISGSCDAFIPEADMQAVYPMWHGGNVLWELKTMGTYSFDKQIGLNRMRTQTHAPEGPKLAAITQAGMNALGIEKARGIEIGTILLGSITFEAVSKNKAKSLGLNDVSRVIAEFLIERSQWEPLARNEWERMEAAAENVEWGYLPPRLARDEHGTEVTLNPLGRDWQCDYCQFRRICVQDGQASISITESSAQPRKEQ